MTEGRKYRLDVISCALGLASAVVGIAALSMLIMIVPDVQHPEYEPIRLAARYMALVATPLLALPALVLGLLDIRRRGTDAFFSILGAVFAVVGLAALASSAVVVAYG